MRLSDEEQAMLAGELGEARRWAISHRIAVGEFFDADDFVPVSQAHIMADTESLGEAGVRFLEALVADDAELARRSDDIETYFELAKEGENTEADLTREIPGLTEFAEPGFMRSSAARETMRGPP